jgi:hypothetical protein
VRSALPCTHLDEHASRNWLNPRRSCEADLKKRTLTTCYNRRVRTWLANAHAALDGPIFAVLLLAMRNRRRGDTA